MRPVPRRIRHVTATLICVGLSISGACRTVADPSPTPILTLDDALRMALAQNHALRAGAADVAKAADQVSTARADLLPVVRIKAEGGALLDPLHVRVPRGSLGTVDQAPFPTHDASLYSASGGIGLIGASIAQPLTQLPAIRLNVHLQELGVQVAQEQQRGRRAALATAVRQTYYAILETQDGIVSDEATLKSDQEMERTVTDFVAHETALQADLLDAQAQTAQQELALTQQQDSLADAKEKLNVLLGRDIATPFDVTLPADTTEALDDLPSLRARALSHRPDLREATLRVQQAEIGQHLAQQPNLPAVSLVLSDDQLAGSIHGLPTRLAILGLQLDWSPLDWGKHQATQDEQNQQRAQATAMLQDAQSQALLEVDSKARQYTESRTQMTVAQAAQRAAQERLREMLNQYKDKAILLKDVLQQQSAAAAADTHVQQTMAQMLAARTALETAVGEDE